MYILVNVKTIELDLESSQKLNEFHSKLFLDVLGVKDFITRNYFNGENSYLVVPIYTIGKINF